MAALPRLIMTCVVRDEADLLEDWLRYHRAQGVAQFLIVEHRSLDATPEILAAYAARGWLRWWQETGLKCDQGRWMTGMARLAAGQLAADWVIHNDADEFWLSAAGTLQQQLAQVPADARLIRARRHNFAALRPSDARPWWQRLIHRFAVSHNFIGQPLSAKVAHRADPGIVVHHGSHSVAPMSVPWPGKAFEILHFPARDYAQFERKIRHGGAAWRALLGDGASGLAEAKRALYELYLLGRLPEWYAAWAYDAEELQAALAAGELVTDTRLSEAIARLD